MWHCPTIRAHRCLHINALIMAHGMSTPSAAPLAAPKRSLFTTIAKDCGDRSLPCPPHDNTVRLPLARRFIQTIGASVGTLAVVVEGSREGPQIAAVRKKHTVTDAEVAFTRIHHDRLVPGLAAVAADSNMVSWHCDACPHDSCLCAQCLAQNTHPAATAAHTPATIPTIPPHPSARAILRLPPNGAACYEGHAIGVPCGRARLSTRTGVRAGAAATCSSRGSAV